MRLDGKLLTRMIECIEGKVSINQITTVDAQVWTITYHDDERACVATVEVDDKGNINLRGVARTGGDALGSGNVNPVFLDNLIARIAKKDRCSPEKIEIMMITDLGDDSRFSMMYWNMSKCTLSMGAGEYAADRGVGNIRSLYASDC